jgi:hypothetical protein
MSLHTALASTFFFWAIYSEKAIQRENLEIESQFWSGLNRYNASKSWLHFWMNVPNLDE